MRILLWIFIPLFTGIAPACRQKPTIEPGNTTVKEVTLATVEDEVPPPPPNLHSKFKTLQDWLFSICDGEQPAISIANYNLGIFESPDEIIVFLAGLNKYEKGDTAYTHIAFEPATMYYQLPAIEYKAMSRDKLLAKLEDQLKAFTNTAKFKASFLAKADAIILESNGHTIWSK